MSSWDHSPAPALANLSEVTASPSSGSPLDTSSPVVAVDSVISPPPLSNLSLLPPSSAHISPSSHQHQTRNNSRNSTTQPSESSQIPTSTSSSTENSHRETTSFTSPHSTLNFKGGDCIVCYSCYQSDGYSTPVFFQCGHSICKRCSERLQEPCSHSFAPTKRKVRCPTCFTYSPYPLVKNYELINLLEANNSLGNSSYQEEDHIPNKICENCEKSGAVKYCVNCVISLCQSCDEILHHSNVMKKHSRGNIHSQMTTNFTLERICELHRGEVIKLFCQNCHQAICRDCALFDQHNGHTVRLITTVASDYRQRLMILKSHLSSLNHSLQQTHRRHQDLNSSLSLSLSLNATLVPDFVPPVNHVGIVSDLESSQFTLSSSVATSTPTGNSNYTDANPPHELRYDDPTPVPETVMTGSLPPTNPSSPRTSTATTTSTSGMPPALLSTEYQAKLKLIKSQFQQFRDILKERESVLIKELELRYILQQNKQLEYINSLERILSKVQSGLVLVQQLSSNFDDTEVCLKFFDVKSLLESVLNCSLAEQLSSRPVPLIFPTEVMNEITQYGYIGSPSTPLTLKSSFLQDGSRILLTWQQKVFPVSERREGMSSLNSSQRREDIVKFIIQRGVTDLTSLQTSSSQHVDSISTASVPASVSVDRVDHLEEDGLMDDSSHFIHFENIGEVYFEEITSQSEKILKQSSPETSQSTNIPHRSLDIESPSLPSSIITPGVPPFASLTGISEEEEEIESNEETKMELSPTKQTSTSSFSSSAVHYSQHSFEFDSFDYPLKLLHFRVKSINRDGLASDWSSTTCIFTPNSYRKEFIHSTNLSQPFDNCGLLYYLGTVAANKYTSRALNSSSSSASSSSSSSCQYLNPHTMGMVHVSMSSILNSNLSQPSQIIDHVPVGYNCTGGESPEQWISIDLTEGKLFQPTGYSLRSSQIHQLCHWEFQGKRLESPHTWVTLHRSHVPLESSSSHSKQSSSPTQTTSPYTEGYFSLDPLLPSSSSSSSDSQTHPHVNKFQIFRILMTGKNSNGENYLFCSGVELYGTLFY